jgi:malic enzyme
MYKAAALAIAGEAHKDEIIPKLLDPKVHLAVTHSVAKAAIESGVAERQLDEDYFEDTKFMGPF